MTPAVGPAAPPTPENLAAAGRHIRAGRLVAFPTETVYGLGADATNERAVAAVFEAKGRPRFNPLIVHFPARGPAEEVAAFDRRAGRLAEKFWPGPLTLVLPRRPRCALSLLVSAGLDTVAVRVPAHDVALRLLREAGRPVAAPSANPSGAVSPTMAAHVAEALGTRVAMILDGGPCAIGLESTVLDLAGPQAVLLRPGGIPRAQIEAVIGPVIDPVGGTAELPAGTAAVRSPGMLEHHYATRLPLRLNVGEGASRPRPHPRPREALLSFGRHGLTGFAAEMNLSPSGDLGEAAANLFAMLRALDRPEFSAIAVMAIPETGLGAAINDRLRRAAGGRLAAGENAAQMR